MRLDQFVPGAFVRGVVAGETAEVTAVAPIGSTAVTVTFRLASGRIDEVLVHRDDAASYSLEARSASWDVTADGGLFRLAAEAHRIRLAHLFDPLLAVHLSSVRPLPHQIDAVYGQMLPRVPMRYALCDDPGAGKTIMAGLYVKELQLRGDLQRCLIVAPGGLVGQWQDELIEKFDLHFEIVSRESVEASHGANPFRDGHQLLIVRLDQLARNSVLLDRACQVDWDVVICDEAHRMAAHARPGGEVHYTKRYWVGQRLGASCRNFLLLTATPHAGKDDDFQHWMALLDSDRFGGRVRDGAHVADVSDVMRRMVKEKLLTFEGTRLFPERRAYTVEYELSSPEQALYEAVTEYVREEMGRADRVVDESGNVRQRAGVGFALTSLQRRLASSPEAILVSISRRLRRLRLRAEELRRSGSSKPIHELIAEAERLLDVALDDDAAGYEELTPKDEERLEQLVDGSSAATTLAELDFEIATLSQLELLAHRVKNSGVDKKWQELSGLIAMNPELHAVDGSPRKVIIFTEHKDTLHYLVDRLRAQLGDDEAVVFIHGGTVREERRAIQERFNFDPRVRILVATDAAGEGVNLQRAHLMVNYDLPWNPNRIEQRFGRIHRIGQDQVCHLWNLVASGTREGAVYITLLNKLEQQRLALGDQVFDVLGQAFQGNPLRELLIDAIRYGEQPERQAHILEVIDSQVGERLADLVDSNALDTSVMDLAKVDSIRLQMEEAEARRLQPHYIRSFWRQAFALVGGIEEEQESGRHEVTRVPQALRLRDRITGGGAPLLNSYERVCFDPALSRLSGFGAAVVVRPGHPLLDTVVDSILERYEPVLLRGAVLIDDQDDSLDVRVLVGFDDRVTSGRLDNNGQRSVVSRRFAFCVIDADGQAHEAGPAPYLDLRPATEQEREMVRPHIVANVSDRESVLSAARALVVDRLTASHLREVKARTDARLTKMRYEVDRRLAAEAEFWDHRARDLALQAEAGKQPKMNPMQARSRCDELLARRSRRLSELDADRSLAALPPAATAVAVVVPMGLLSRLGGVALQEVRDLAAGREAVEQRAVGAVLRAESWLGRKTEVQPKNNPGFDLKSFTPDGHLLLIEVKGRIEGSPTVTVTRTEILTALNSDRFVLALVEVSKDGPQHDVVRYLRHPFTGTDDQYFDVTSVNFNWSSLWSRASPPS